jgi:hypothetical protein
MLQFTFGEINPILLNDLKIIIGREVNSSWLLSFYFFCFIYMMKEQVKSGLVESSQVESSRVKSSQVKSSRVKSSQVESSRVKSSQVESSRVKSSQVESSW